MRSTKKRKGKYCVTSAEETVDNQRESKSYGQKYEKTNIKPKLRSTWKRKGR